MLSREQIISLLLLRNREGNIFSRLPNELLLREICHLKDENALIYAINADYKNFFKILSINPYLMFKESKAIDINGKMIKTSPLEYVLYNLDCLSWQICHKISKLYPDCLMRFNETAQKVNDYVDLTKLFDAYELYFKNFEIYKEKKSNKKQFFEAFYEIGKGQRELLPRHMLKEMCLLPINLWPASHNLILISLPLFDKIDEISLKQISKNHPNRLILIKQDSNFTLCTPKLFEDGWSLHKLPRLPFKAIDFPRQYNQPILKNRETTLRYNFNCEHGDYWPWDKMNALVQDYNPKKMQDSVYSNGLKSEVQFEQLLPLGADSTLGKDCILARGGSAFCFNVDNPEGYSGFLKHKTKDDLDSFRALQQIRIAERKSLYSQIAEERPHLEQLCHTARISM